MNRRAFLGCAALIPTAGCIDRITGDSSSEQSDVDAEGGSFGDFTVTADSEDAAPLEYTVSIPNHSAYNDEPLQIQLEVENTSSSTDIEIGDYRDAFFWFYSSEGFALYPVDEIEDTPNTETAQDVATGTWYLDGSLIWEDIYQTTVIESGDTMTETLTVLYTSESDFPDSLPPELEFTAIFNSIAASEGDVETDGWETEVTFQVSS